MGISIPIPSAHQDLPTGGIDTRLVGQSDPSNSKSRDALTNRYEASRERAGRAGLIGRARVKKTSPKTVELRWRNRHNMVADSVPVNNKYKYNLSDLRVFSLALFIAPGRHLLLMQLLAPQCVFLILFILPVIPFCTSLKVIVELRYRETNLLLLYSMI